MAVKDTVVKAGLALGAGVLGFFLLPMLVGGITGALAGVLDGFGQSVPLFLQLEFWLKRRWLVAAAGMALGIGWVVSR